MPSRLGGDSDAFDALGNRSHRPRARVWRYVWAPLAGLAILVVLIVTTRVVLAVAGRKDHLRQAEIAIAAAGQTEFAMMHAPVGLIGGQVAGAGEYTLSAQLRSTLMSEMTQLQHQWPTSLARRAHADVQALVGQIVVLMDLIHRHRLGAAGGLYRHPITPMSQRYLAELTRAQNALHADTNGADDRAAVAASGIAAVAGVLLLLLFLVSAAARGRLQRADVEEGVLAALATTDSLTGVPNHRALILSLRAEFERARRYQRPLGLLFMDIDHFK